MRLLLNMLFSFILVFIRLLRLPQDRVCQWFIQINNRLVLAHIHSNLKDEHLLFLIPHCLQNYDCEFKITNQIRNCRRCGKCIINDLIHFADEHHLNLSAASGGTLARKIIKEYQPSLIIAVGCERELESGINDVYPLPVIGILNQRPEGPCKNTTVNMTQVDEIIQAVQLTTKTRSKV